MANLKKAKKYHFTYKTTNLINKRYYLGMHSTNRLDDGYVGSGKRLWYELRKYGRDNFTIEILKYYNSREELIKAEKKLITEQVINKEDCLNLKTGGSGGFTLEQTRNGRKKTNRILEKKYGPNWNSITSKKYQDSLSEADKKELSEKIKKRQKEVNFNHATFKGKKHSEESKKKMSESSKGKGINNSQFGTCWITNEKENKKIYKGDLIPEGWRLGRKI